MNASARRVFFRRVFYAAWGMFTLMLIFCIVFLALTMRRQEKDPLALVREKPPAAPAPVQAVEPEAAKEVPLYFADIEGHLLEAEPTRIEFTEFTVENCRRALEALIHGPQKGRTPIVPDSARIRGMYLLDDGELVVDFSLELEMALRKIRSASLEALFVYGVVDTLAQPALKGGKERDVARVRFLIEGSAPRGSFPSHVDVSQPIGPDAHWIVQAPPASKG